MSEKIKNLADDVAELVMEMYYDYLISNDKSDKEGYDKLYDLTMNYYLKKEEYEKCQILKDLK